MEDLKELLLNIKVFDKNKVEANNDPEESDDRPLTD